MEDNLAEECKAVDEHYQSKKVESLEEVKSLIDLAEKCMRSYKNDFKKKSINYLSLGIEFVEKDLSDH